MSKSAAVCIEEYGTAFSDREPISNYGKRKSASIEFAPTLFERKAKLRVSEVLHPLFTLNINGQNINLNKPISLRVVREADRYVAENAYLDICSSGETVQEALQDASEDIFYYYNFYTNLGDDELIGFGGTLKERFSNLVVL